MSDATKSEATIVWETREKAKADGDMETVELVDALYHPGRREALEKLLKGDWPDCVRKAFQGVAAGDPDDMRDVSETPNWPPPLTKAPKPDSFR